MVGWHLESSYISSLSLYDSYTLLYIGLIVPIIVSLSLMDFLVWFNPP